MRVHLYRLHRWKALSRSKPRDYGLATGELVTGDRNGLSIGWIYCMQLPKRLESKKIGTAYNWGGVHEIVREPNCWDTSTTI